MMIDRVNDVVELPIERYGGMVRLDPRQKARNRRRAGATVRAAERLGRYRLRRYLRLRSLTPVSDVEVFVGDVEFIRDTMSVGVSVRAVSVPWEFDGELRVPEGSSRLSMVRP